MTVGCAYCLNESDDMHLFESMQWEPGINSASCYGAIQGAPFPVVLHKLLLISFLKCNASVPARNLNTWNLNEQGEINQQNAGRLRQYNILLPLPVLLVGHSDPEQG